MANEIYDGTRVVTAASGDPYLDTDHNQLQDLLILGLQAREHAVSLVSGVSIANWALTYSMGSTPGFYWLEGTNGADTELVFPLKLRVGEYITAGEAWIDSDNTTGTGGRIEIRRSDPTAVSADESVADLTNSDANPWAYSTLKKHTSAALTHEVAADWDYYVLVKNPSGGTIGDNWFYGARITTRFHAGA